MPEVNPTNESVRAFQGLHLYHFGISNCSQRVRMLLEEKGLAWTSHVVDIERNEHATPEYQGINPRGLVPALVHDGRVFIESVDIILHLEQAFPTPPKAFKSGPELAAMNELLRRAGDVQGAVKILTHEYLVKATRRTRARQFPQLEAAHGNPNLVAFHREFVSPQGIARFKIESSILRMHKEFADLDAALGRGPGTWLAGGDFSLADIAWTVNVHRMRLLGLPMREYRRLNGWYDRVRERPSYRAAITAYEPAWLAWAARIYGFLRRFSPSAVPLV